MRAAFLALLLAAMTAAQAHDDGRYANSPLKAWFDGLQSDKGLCCSFADGVKVEEVDWDTQDGKYRVRLCAEPPLINDGDHWASCKNRAWFVVPDPALVKSANRFGPPVVWPIIDYSTNEPKTGIRCFLPGAGA